MIVKVAFEVYFCHILECVNTLFGDPEFAPILLLVPKHHYANANHTIHVYFDINVGRWATQVSTCCSLRLMSQKN